MIGKPLVKVSCNGCDSSVEVFEIDLKESSDVITQRINNDLNSNDWYTNGIDFHLCPTCRELDDES